MKNFKERFGFVPHSETESVLHYRGFADLDKSYQHAITILSNLGLSPKITRDPRIRSITINFGDGLDSGK